MCRKKKANSSPTVMWMARNISIALLNADTSLFSRPAGKTRDSKILLTYAETNWKHPMVRIQATVCICHASIFPRSFIKRRMFPDFGRAVIPGAVEPISQMENIHLLCGKYKGIQGHNNSCYLDATLFSMFTFTRLVFGVRRPRWIVVTLKSEWYTVS